MGAAVADAVGRAVVAGRAADRDAERRGVLERLVVGRARLRGPRGFSASPQLIEITDGLRSLSCTAAVIASRKPAVVLGAK